MQNGTYRLATYTIADGDARAGIVVDEHLIDVSTGLGLQRDLPADHAHSTVLSILNDWPSNHEALKVLAAAVRGGKMADELIAIKNVTLLAPILYPGAIYCAGANYRDHVEEMVKAFNLPTEPDPHEVGLKPWHFMKPSVACVRGSGALITLPAYSKCVDWEAEIAVVIGRPCYNVAIEDALEYVAGITIVNDLSARDNLRRNAVPVESPFRYDWVSHKGFDGALPMGPWIRPLEEIPNSGNLRIRLWVNDTLMQDSCSSNLIFSIAEQISHLSTRLTLQPGDVIATGTPAGCGMPRNIFLKSGDRVRIWVEDVGELTSDFA
jgi:2-keto-4-pentenoate hydratase/2-oxohepta-3-ene-1,7-dioic acid hydratase in catechol pathway